MEERRVFGVAAKKTMSKKDGVDSSSPWEACKDLWELKAVGDDDDVWDKFLPWDYGEILARAGVSPGVITKKQAYLLLFGSPFLLDHGKLVSLVLPLLFEIILANSFIYTCTNHGIYEFLLVFLVLTRFFF